jgi:hypothetical protein
MNVFFKPLAAALAVAAILTSTTARAECWTPVAVEAAQVRDLETMLMVASLRCRLSGNDFIAQYNSFVRDNRPALIAANEELRTHFASSGGLNAYDSYVTSVANSYGGGAGGLNCGDMQSILSAAQSAGGSLSGLVRLAKSAEVEPKLPGNRCPAVVALAH